VAAYVPERETSGTGQQVVFAAVVAVVAIATLYLGENTQQRITQSLQASVLRPFIWTQETLAQTRVGADQIDFLQSEVDSLTAVVSTQAALVDENRTLRELLGLSERAGPSYVRATVIRPGTPGSESMFIVDVGRADGVEMYAPVVSAHGLVGRIIDVRARSATGMDWTHPDFRAGAMLQDGSAYGMVENVRGQFREDDRLVLNGTAYHESLEMGGQVLTSGLGGTFPRGIPIGRLDGTAEVEGTWRKSYWLRPSVEPGSVTHVLIATVGASADVTEMWFGDTIETVDDGTVRAPGL
jgi:rod shape-determining protein MreC